MTLCVQASAHKIDTCNLSLWVKVGVANRPHVTITYYVLDQYMYILNNGVNKN